MKIKWFIMVWVILLCQITLHAHLVVLQAFDNEDGTMEIFGGFNTGVSASGAKLIIRSKANSTILYENRVPDSGTLIVQIPQEPYKIILDSGPGHRIEKEPNIEPLQGFNQESQAEPTNMAFITTLSLSLLFLLASIILSIKNRRYF